MACLVLSLPGPLFYLISRVFVLESFFGFSTFLGALGPKPGTPLRKHQRFQQHWLPGRLLSFDRCFPFLVSPGVFCFVLVLFLMLFVLKSNILISRGFWVLDNQQTLEKSKIKPQIPATRLVDHPLPAGRLYFCFAWFFGFSGFGLKYLDFSWLFSSAFSLRYLL